MILVIVTAENEARDRFTSAQNREFALAVSKIDLKLVEL